MTKPSNPFKIWMTAVRPFAYSASVSSVLLGTAIAFYDGHPFLWGRFLLTFAGVIIFHTAANLLNDRFDYERGLDRVVLPMSGAVVRGWLTPGQVTRAAAELLIIGIGIGLALTVMAGWPVLFLGVAGTLLVLFYTRSGFCLKYAALGDLAIFLAFGALPVFGAYYVQAEAFSLRPLLWSLPLVSYTVGILHANNWHDLEDDPKIGCRTVATLLGDRRSGIYYRWLMLGPFLLVILFFLSGWLAFHSFQSPVTVFAVMPVFPIALKLARIDRRSNLPAFLMLDGLTARMQLPFGVLLSIAFVVGKYLPA